MVSAAVDPVLADLDERIRVALSDAGLPDGDPGFERPRQPDHGDWASTLGLRLAKVAGMNPRDVAEQVIAHLVLPPKVASVEVAGPGFLNFHLAPEYFADLVLAVIQDGPRYGRRASGSAAGTINVEFVSGNPTGPLHVGHGRWAATGDTIAELLAASGHRVTREYYVNDAGGQVHTFGESVVRVARDEPLDDHHYQGQYVVEIADALRAEHGDDLFDDVDRAGELAIEAMRASIEATLHRMGVDFDEWISERALHASGAIDDAIEQLRAADHTYEKDGATFLRTEAHGDDKDRVLVRSDGRPTYFAADCAYMRDKWSRADVLYYLLGADHHGYVGRLKAAAACLGIPPDAIEIRIGQLVTLLRGGQPVKMGKRSGNFVELGEVIDEVGVDVTRYHFLRPSLDAVVDFDLAVVARQSMENPVYYVQYAHARIASVIRTADERGFDHGRVEDADLAAFDHPAEADLLRAMSRMRETVAEAAELRATQRLAHYAEELAGTFHRFYTECSILNVDDPGRARARYWLAVAAKQVLANTLGLLRVSAPDRM